MPEPKEGLHKILEQDGMQLQYVTVQTEEDCLIAVRQNGMALQFVKVQTEQICIAAYKQNPDSLQFSEFSIEILTDYVKKSLAKLEEEKRVGEEDRGVSKVQSTEFFVEGNEISENVRKQYFLEMVNEEARSPAWQGFSKLSREDKYAIIDCLVVQEPELLSRIAKYPADFRNVALRNMGGGSFTIANYYNSI